MDDAIPTILVGRDPARRRVPSDSQAGIGSRPGGRRGPPTADPLSMIAEEPRSDPNSGEDRDEAVGPLPVVAEQVRVDKRAVVRSRVRVSTRTETVELRLQEDVSAGTAAVSRVRIDRVLAPGEPVPRMRREGSVTIVPVFDEILVVERRLVLREEVRIDHSVETRRVEIPITLLRQRAVIERVSTDGVVTPLDHPNQDNLAMKHTITALFDQEAKARIAMDDLIEAGIPRSDVRVVPGSADSVARSTGSYDLHKDEGGFWQALKGIFMPDEDRYAYSEGLSRGGSMVSVSVAEADRDRVSDMLERSGAVDLDQREASWREGGWAGYPGASTGLAGPSGRTGSDVATATEDATFASGSLSGTLGQTIGNVVGAPGAGNETDYIPVVEERLDIGKRVVDHGRVRLRSYVVETPVQEQVSLRDEVVHVDRRKVDRPLSSGDVDPFVERVVEVDEKGEEVVVRKEARVVEEVGLRKDGVDRTETVHDKVRRTEVEIEDERRDGAAKPFNGRS